MANITITTTPEEQKAVIEALKKLEGKVAAVSAIADLAGLRQSRVRYALVDLLDAKKIERVPVKAMNKHYVRYSYKVL